MDEVDRLKPSPSCKMTDIHTAFMHCVRTRFSPTLPYSPLYHQTAYTGSDTHHATTGQHSTAQHRAQRRSGVNEEVKMTGEGGKAEEFGELMPR